MGRPCSVCSHPDVQRISRDLLDGIPYRELQRTYGVHPSALTWHRQHHITATLQRIAQAERTLRHDAERAEPVLVEMRRLHLRTLKILDAAEASQDQSTALAAIHAARKNLELIGKLTGELDARSSEQGSLQVQIIYSERSQPIVDANAPILDAVPAALPEPE